MCDFRTEAALNGHIGAKHVRVRTLKACDGTWQDYRRHKRNNTTPCAESRKAWREYVASRRRAK